MTDEQTARIGTILDNIKERASVGAAEAFAFTEKRTNMLEGQLKQAAAVGKPLDGMQVRLVVGCIKNEFQSDILTVQAILNASLSSLDHRIRLLKDAPANEGPPAQ